MPADAASDAHLQELRRRWQAEPGSRLFLQLAEEYRRAGRHAEAAEVLEKGIGQQPSHVSGHVALGRVRLEMGEPGNAARALERAVELDITNLVANKLLVEAYLERGEREKARQRLDLYRLLNDSDPDLAELRRRIESGGRGAAAGAGGDGEATADRTADASRPGAAPAPELMAGPEPARDELAEGRAWGGEATAESLEPPPAGVPVADDERERGADREEEPMTTRSAGDGREGTPGADEPFGDLAAGGAAARYFEGLTGEGLFALPAAAEAAAPGGADAAPPSSPSAAAPPPAPDAPPETLPEPRPAEIEALAECVGGTAAQDADGTAAQDAGEPAAARPGRGEAERPTVTLGQLYLDQGHFRQAREVFRALLDDEPDHAVARRGLDRAERELAAAGPEPVTAAELLREAEPEQPARRAVLGAYLARILRARESRPSDVPR